MASKDPFNFDDIYKQAGVGDLFVKKTMAEQKAGMASSRTISSSPTPPRPPQEARAGAPAAGPGMSHTSPQRVVMSSSPSSSNSLAGLDDPFASLATGFSKPQPMAGTSRTNLRASSSTPPAAPAAGGITGGSTASAAAFDLPVGQWPSTTPATAAPAAPAPAPPPAAAAATSFELDDMFGLSGKAALPAQPAAAPAVVEDDPFAAFEHVPGAAPAVEASVTSRAGSGGGDSSASDPPSASATGNSPTSASSTPSAAAALGVSPPAGPATPPDPVRPARTAHHEPEPTLASFSDLARTNAGDISPRTAAAIAAAQAEEGHQGNHRHLVHPPHQQQQQQWAGEGQYGEGSSGRYPPFGQYPGAAEDWARQDSSSGGGAGGGGSGKGWGGLFKGLGKTAAELSKKGLKAAQAGLAQLESALDNLDGRAVGGRTSQQGEGAPYDEDLPMEKIITLCIRINELPSSRQEEALARLAPTTRRRVAAMLREQAVAEGEHTLAGLPPALAGGRAGERVIYTEEYNLDEELQQEQQQRAQQEPRARQPQQQQQQRPQQEQEQQRQPGAAAAGAGRAPGTGSSRSASPSPPAAAASSAAPAGAVKTAVPHEGDLLGMGSPTAAAAAAPATPPMDDLLSMGHATGSSSRPATSKLAAAAAAPVVADVADVDDFFSGGAAAPQPAASSRAGGAAAGTGGLADLLGGSSGRPAAARSAAKHSSSVDLAAVMHVDVSQHSELYNDADDGPGDANEPEERRRLRAARLAEKHAKMKAALLDKQAKEEEEASRRQQQQSHKAAHRERIDVWKNKNKGNVRGLLGSLQTVLWEDSGWKPIGMGDLLEPAQVRKAWMKANLLVHPDKVRQRNGTDEQVAIADMIFDALKEAWGQFKG